MNKVLSWTKFKLPTSSKMEALEDEEENPSQWDLIERESYQSPFDRLESAIQGGKFLQTPLGTINLDGSEESGKLFNIWVAHTNFNLTPGDFAAIEHVPGVEALQPISRYRFQLAIGFNFNENEVKALIEETLIGSIRIAIIEVLQMYKLVNPTLTKRAKEKHESVVSTLQSHWVSWVLPNEEVILLTSDILDNNFFDAVVMRGLAQSLVGGSIDSSLIRGDNGETSKI